MKMILSLFALLAATLCGCSVTASLYPVEGPLSKVTPLPIIKATVHGVLGDSGDIDLTMPDGEVCEGQWSSTGGVSASYKAGSLFSQYGGEYWAGYNIDGNRGQAIAVGERGRVIEVEFYTRPGTASGFGIARDNKGNVYKVFF